MATYVVTLKHGFGKTAKAQTKNRMVKVIAPDSRTARQIAEYLRGAMSRTLRARLGYLLARDAFQTLREKLDPRKSNGGVFLGLNGIVIKSHGGTDAEGFASAIDLGYDMVRYELRAKINQMLGGRTAAESLAPLAGGASL